MEINAIVTHINKARGHVICKTQEAKPRLIYFELNLLPLVEIGQTVKVVELEEWSQTKPDMKVRRIVPKATAVELIS